MYLIHVFLQNDFPLCEGTVASSSSSGNLKRTPSAKAPPQVYHDRKAQRKDEDDPVFTHDPWAPQEDDLHAWYNETEKVILNFMPLQFINQKFEFIYKCVLVL